MNCKIESMSDNRRTNVDTLPPRGRVNEVRREWLLHEDEALAYRLQDEEIKQHLTGNKSRNIQIREDIPRAKDEQKREVEEATRIRQQFLLQQEQQDARVAAQLAHVIEKEEDRRRLLEEEDKELAKLLQDKEKQRIERRERERRELESHTPRREGNSSYDWKYQLSRRPESHEESGSKVPDMQYPQCFGAAPPVDNGVYYKENFDDMNNVGLPVQDDIVQSFRNCSLGGYSSYSRHRTPSPPLISEEEARRIQEEKDEEFARYLQEKENLESLDSLKRDRLLAIETQDKELARLLQEKERAKARRAKERAREKAALRRMQEQNMSNGVVTADEEHVTIKTAETVQVNVHKNLNGDDVWLQNYKPSPLNAKYPVVKNKPRYPDPEEIMELEPNRSSSPVVNIAMTIDPTYSRDGTERLSKSKKVYSRYNADTEGNEDSLDDRINTNFSSSGIGVCEDVTAPPYMPIQGQRRLPEKKVKQKDGCKQQ